jgi:hypothetical protein
MRRGVSKLRHTLAKLLAAYQKLDSYLDQALQDIQEKVAGDPATVAANLLSHQSRESNVAAISELMRAIADNPALAVFEPKLLLKYITTNRVENGFSAHRIRIGVRLPTTTRSSKAGSSLCSRCSETEGSLFRDDAAPLTKS